MYSQSFLDLNESETENLFSVRFAHFSHAPGQRVRAFLHHSHLPSGFDRSKSVEHREHFISNRVSSFVPSLVFPCFFVDLQCVQRIESRAERDEQLSAIRDEGQPLRSHPRFHGLSAVCDHWNVRWSVSERVGAEMIIHDVQTSWPLHQGMRVSGQQARRHRAGDRIRDNAREGGDYFAGWSVELS